MSYKVVRLAHAGKRNRYLAATGIAFIGYVLFLSSALWFPGQKKSMEYTPLGIQQEIGAPTRKTASSTTPTTLPGILPPA